MLLSSNCRGVVVCLVTAMLLHSKHFDCLVVVILLQFRANDDLSTLMQLLSEGTECVCELQSTQAAFSLLLPGMLVEGALPRASFEISLHSLICFHTWFKSELGK